MRQPSWMTDDCLQGQHKFAKSEGKCFVLKTLLWRGLWLWIFGETMTCGPHILRAYLPTLSFKNQEDFCTNLWDKQAYTSYFLYTYCPFPCRVCNITKHRHHTHHHIHSDCFQSPHGVSCDCHPYAQLLFLLSGLFQVGWKLVALFCRCVTCLVQLCSHSDGNSRLKQSRAYTCCTVTVLKTGLGTW